jgi:type II secretion system protein C
VYIKRLMLNTKQFTSNFRDEKVWRLAINLCLALLLAHTLASLTWVIAGPAGGTISQEGKAVKRAQGLPVLTSRAMVVTTEAALFGKAGRVETSPVPLSLDTLSAPPTSLSLELKGVIVAEPMSRALAAISEKGSKKEKLYGVGDKVPGNGVITEILVDRVILRRGGTLETLMLLNKKAAHSAKKGPRGQRTTGKKITSLGDGVHWQVDNAYLNKRLADIPSLAREVGVEIYKEGNVQKGYRLVSSRGSKLLRDMGLQPGDILNEVNGLPMNSVHDGLTAYQGMRNAKEIRLVITRNGRRETRIYEINSSR